MGEQPESKGHQRSDAIRESEVLAPLRAALDDADESGRYRLLASLLGGLADRQDSERGRTRVSEEQIEALRGKTQMLEETKAELEDSLRLARADLSRSQATLEAEQAGGRELRQVADDRSERAEALRKRVAEMEAELVDRNNAVHRAESEKEDLVLRLQRAELAAGDTSSLEQRDEANRQLVRELERVREDADGIRAEKDAEIERLRAELAATGAGKGAEADALLAGLWDRLASAKPALIKGGEQPTVQAAERLVDALIELVRFTDDLDQSMRPFLAEYTRDDPAVKVPWGVYAERAQFRPLVEQVLAPVKGTPAGALRANLKTCHRWVFSGMLANDVALKSVASELQSQLRGEHGTGADPNMKIMDYVRSDGHELFMDHMLKVRSGKLVEVYGHGG